VVVGSVESLVVSPFYRRFVDVAVFFFVLSLLFLSHHLSGVGMSGRSVGRSVVCSFGTRDATGYK
jgi:hypothetical protein